MDCCLYSSFVHGRTSTYVLHLCGAGVREQAERGPEHGCGRAAHPAEDPARLPPTHAQEGPHQGGHPGQAHGDLYQGLYCGKQITVDYQLFNFSEFYGLFFISAVFSVRKRNCSYTFHDYIGW